MRTPEQVATALECLRLACDYNSDPSAEIVLARAEKYYAFATGEEPESADGQFNRLAPEDPNV